MIKALKLVIVSLISVYSYAEEPTAAIMKLTAKEYLVQVIDRPQTSSLPEKTLTARSFSYASAKDHTVSWLIKDDKVQLITTSSNGAFFDLPKGFIVEKKQLTPEEWQLGSYKNGSFSHLIVISVRKKSKD